MTAVTFEQPVTADIMPDDIGRYLVARGWREDNACTHDVTRSWRRHGDKVWCWADGVNIDDAVRAIADACEVDPPTVLTAIVAARARPVGGWSSAADDRAAIVLALATMAPEQIAAVRAFAEAQR